MTTETSPQPPPQAYRVRIPEELQPALDALDEATRSALLSALFERAGPAPLKGEGAPRERLELSALSAELEWDVQSARLTLRALRAQPSAATPAAVPGSAAPALAAQQPSQDAWEQTGWL
jgi:hypothetical protein